MLRFTSRFRLCAGLASCIVGVALQALGCGSSGDEHPNGAGDAGVGGMAETTSGSTSSSSTSASSSTTGSTSTGGPAGHLFPCGDGMCDSATHYCLRHAYQAACPGMEYETCEELLPGCGPTPSCDCVPMDICEDGDMCSEKNGGLHGCTQEVG